jgi:two-component system, NtrC family, sensor kinase
VTYAWLIPLVAAVATLALAILVNRVGARTEPGQVFTFLASVLVFWNLNFFVLYYVSDHNLALGLTRIVRVGGLFAPPAILHLAIALRPRRSELWWKVLAVDYCLTFLIVILNAFDLIVADVRSFAWGYSSVGTRYYNLLTLSVFGNFAASIILLAYEYYTSEEPRIRLQLKFWLLGAAIALPLALTNLLPAYGIRFYPLGSLGEVTFIAIVGYAIARHRMMDIDLVVTKGMAYATGVVLLIAPASVLTLLLQKSSFGEVHTEFSVAIILLFITVALLFPTLRVRAESRIERSFFREKHEYRAALIAFTRSIVRILDREKLICELAETLSDTLQIESIAIALGSQSFDSNELLAIRHTIGVPVCVEEFPSKGQLVECLSRRQQAVLRYELETSNHPEERTIVADICRRNGWELCIPLTVGRAIIGFIGLGRKRNLDAFYSEDLELLQTLAAEASVALENARLYEELKRSQDIIRRADRLSALGTLAAGIAHEVRNPLVSIQTFFQLAPERLHDEEFFTTFLGMAAGEVKRISDLITELLSFARSPTRSLGPVNLNEVAERVATLLEPEARNHKLTLSRTLSPNLPLVHADGDQIKQVLINLILNAIQATEPGGEVFVISRLAELPAGAFGQLEIRDTGVGIRRDRLDDIFNPFFTTKDKGTGLGLAIAHQIIAEHGGSIVVESEEGQGTRFLVSLPAYAEDTVPSHTEEGSISLALFSPRYAAAGKLAS